MSARVLLVSHYFPPHLGGIENVVQGEAAGLAKEGYDVTVLTTAVDGPVGSERAEAGYSVVRLPAYNGIERRTGVPFPLPAPWSVRAVVRCVRQVDVVHCHDILYMTTWFAAVAATLLGKPIVLTQHVDLVRHPSRIVGIVQRLVYATVGRVVVRRAVRIAVLNGVVHEFVRRLGAPADRIVLVPNGVDTDRFHPATPVDRQRLRHSLGLPDRDVLALFVGRFVPKKGYDLLLEAAGDEYVLVLAGGSPPRGKPPDGVIFLGCLPPDELAEVYRACDVFILPSESEGFPLTVQEAMACGLPVITTDDPGYGVYGFDRERVAFIRRAVPDMRAALRRLAADDELRGLMGRYSAQVANDRFAWHEHVSGIKRMYAHAFPAPEES